MPRVRVLSRGLRVRQVQFEGRPRGRLLGEASAHVREALGGRDELGRKVLLGVLVRGLDVGECLFERASGGNRLGERGAELGLAPRESFGYVSDLRRALLTGTLECCGGIAQSLLESVACCRSLHHRVVVLRLHVGETRCRRRQLRGPLPVRVLPRSLGVGYSLLQGRAGEGLLSEPFFELDLAFTRGNGRRRPFLLRRFERLARIKQLLVEDATASAACATASSCRVCVSS